MSAWVSRIDVAGEGPRLGVKDAIDVAGHVTTVGCAALADRPPAEVDADCVATARTNGARIVGKTKLHELCYGTTGINPWSGTPVNPVAPDRVPGGSSSGSAVAVALGEADVALGTDSGGSVRLPAACCGVVGLKTTWGRVPTTGVWPLAPSLDTVGPMAADVAGVVLGMSLLDNDFTVGSVARRVGRLRRAGVAPELEAAVDLALVGVDVVDVELPGWDEMLRAFVTIIGVEGWRSCGALVEDRGDLVGEQVRTLLRASAASAGDLDAALAVKDRWRGTVDAALADVDVLALPTLVGPPAPLAQGWLDNSLVLPFNMSGHPAIALPVPVQGWSMPGSLQLVGPWGAEDVLCATASALETRKAPTREGWGPSESGVAQ